MTNTPDLPRRIFTPDALEHLKRFTDARIGLGQAGASQPTCTVLKFALDHAKARDAISSELDVTGLSEVLADGPWPLTAESAVSSRKEYLTRPDLGRTLSEASEQALGTSGQTCALCIVVADGLSSLAVNQNAAPLVEALKERLPDLEIGTVLLRNGRVACGDKIALALGAKAVLTLIGERPGLSAADSLGAYLTWRPRADTRDSERYCVSNIRRGGMETGAAANLIKTLFEQSRLAGRSGVALPSGE